MQEPRLHGKQHFPLLIIRIPVHGERLAIPLIRQRPQRTETELRDGRHRLTGDGGHLLIKFTLCHLGILATGQETETARTSSGVSARLFGTFLSWLNDHESDVFVITTCNDISKLPPEFARAERFDGVCFLDLPGATQKAAIWNIWLQAFELDRDNLARVLDAAAGLTRFEAEGAFSLSLVRHERIEPPAVWELKSQMLKKSGLSLRQFSCFGGDAASDVSELLPPRQGVLYDDKVLL